MSLLGVNMLQEHKQNDEVEETTNQTITFRVGSQGQLMAANTQQDKKLRKTGYRHGDTVTVRISGKGASLSAKAVFHIWCREAAKYFKLKGVKGCTAEEQMKLVFKHKFLGYRDIQISKTEIKHQLISINEPDSGELFHFMQQVDAYCASKGCLLSRPHDSQYDHWIERGNR